MLETFTTGPRVVLWIILLYVNITTENNYFAESTAGCIDVKLSDVKVEAFKPFIRIVQDVANFTLEVRFESFFPISSRMGLLVPLTEISFIWIHSLHGLLVPSMQLLSVWIHSLHGPLVPSTATSLLLNPFTPWTCTFYSNFLPSESIPSTRTSGTFHSNFFTSESITSIGFSQCTFYNNSFHLNPLASWTYCIPSTATSFCQNTFSQRLAIQSL